MRPIPREILLFVVLGTILVGSLAAGPPIRETPGLRETQLTVYLDRKGARRQFRATVLAKTDDVIVLLTAAHCVKADDASGPVILLTGGEVIEGVLISVIRNPAYQPAPGHEVPGPDNAIIRARVRVANRPSEIAYRELRPASRITEQSLPPRSGGGVTARIIDGKGDEQAISGGNFLNPLWLEWAKGYKPIPGDSGSGVFVVRTGSDGKPSPTLIGVVVGHGIEGGGASLISRRQGWIAEALKDQPDPARR